MSIATENKEGLFAITGVNKIRDFGIQVTPDFKWSDHCGAAAEEFFLDGGQENPVEMRRVCSVYKAFLEPQV